MSTKDHFRVTFWQASTSGLPEEEVTFAELAKQAGYKTALLGNSTYFILSGKKFHSLEETYSVTYM